MAETIPQLIQDWLDGKISSDDAITAAMLSKDVRLNVWATTLMGVRLTKPSDMVKISIC